MKYTWFLFFSLAGTGSSQGQPLASIINAKEVQRIEEVLSSDDMQGRAVFTPGIEKAAAFIIGEFNSAGLKPLAGNSSYRQEFSMFKTKIVDLSVSLGGQPVEGKDVVVVSLRDSLLLDQSSGFEKVMIRPGDDYRSIVRSSIQGTKNRLILVDPSFSRNFARLSYLSAQQTKSDRSLVFILSSTDPLNYRIFVKQSVVESKLTNIVGVLAGSSKKNEYVIFSAHYDHLGIAKPNGQMDSIYNGANDDASGTTAVIMLAKYFAALKNNERTLVFAAFTAEEIGEHGSAYFSSQMDPSRVVAMFNIEMIGTESKWGTNSAYITGFEKTDMGNILQRNLQSTPFKFYPDPYTDQHLFYRSDNASLAKQGVAAHTISTSKMDSEKYYHTVGDEIGTLNMSNMSEIIKAIALSSASIVAGKDTPTRVDTTQLE
jgi:hypothetical protein